MRAKLKKTFMSHNTGLADGLHSIKIRKTAYNMLYLHFFFQEIAYF